MSGHTMRVKTRVVQLDQAGTAFAEGTEILDRNGASISCLFTTRWAAERCMAEIAERWGDAWREGTGIRHERDFTSEALNQLNNRED